MDFDEPHNMVLFWLAYVGIGLLLLHLGVTLWRCM